MSHSSCVGRARTPRAAWTPRDKGKCFAVFVHPSSPRPKPCSYPVLQCCPRSSHQAGQLLVCVASPLAQTLHREALPPARDEPKRNRNLDSEFTIIIIFNFFLFCCCESRSFSHQTAAWLYFRIIGFIVAVDATELHDGTVLVPASSPALSLCILYVLPSQLKRPECLTHPNSCALQVRPWLTLYSLSVSLWWVTEGQKRSQL